MSWPWKRLNGKHRFLHRPIFRPDFLGETQFRQLFAGHDFRGQFGQRHADGLADERHGARRARIHFQHVNHVAFDGVLHVHQADDLQLARHGVGVFADGFDDLLRKRVRRQHHRGVAGMHAGKFDVLQHAADDDGALARIREMAHVRDAIHVHFGGVFQKFVHQHRPLRRSFDGEAHVMLQLGVGINDLHRAAAEHEARAAPARDSRASCAASSASASLVARPFGGCGMFSLCSIAANSLRSSAISMLCGEVPMMLTPFFCKPEREVQRRLPAELRDGAPAFFPLVNVQHVFQRERLEKQFVARVVIGRNGLRIRIDHQRFEAVFLQRERGVDAAIIKFDALADAVRPAAENHHLASCPTARTSSSPRS